MRKLMMILALIATLAIPSSALAESKGDDPQVPSEEAIKLAQSIDQATDPYAAYLALSEKERLMVDSVLGAAGETTTVEETSEYTILASGCWSRTNTKTSTSLGIFQHRISQILQWCGNGSSVTSKNDWVEVSTGTFWQYGGIIDHWTTGGVGWTTYRVHRQAQFNYCPLSVGCGAQTHYPIVDQQGSGNGAYWQN